MIVPLVIHFKTNTKKFLNYNIYLKQLWCIQHPAISLFAFGNLVCLSFFHPSYFLRYQNNLQLSEKKQTMELVVWMNFCSVIFMWNFRRILSRSIALRVLFLFLFRKEEQFYGNIHFPTKEISSQLYSLFHDWCPFVIIW